jgi:hypothetical protein
VTAFGSCTYSKLYSFYVDDQLFDGEIQQFAVIVKQNYFAMKHGGHYLSKKTNCIFVEHILSRKIKYEYYAL